ncbi:MAG TPA: hypothetical protein DEO87_06445, partial [Lachnospiraceae bacterium]|nr:hypothetical protein [Lachnospiraceae bacterium]
MKKQETVQQEENEKLIETDAEQPVLKKKKRRKRNISKVSIRSFIFVGMLIVLLLCMALYSLGIIKSLRKSELQKLKDDVYINAQSMADQIGR